ncbi:MULTISPECIES: hypothetical protein [unclassified Pseudomonas]|uniref:hypothetical protein n=1 Tax=unclassified Pseudomonas TaxID=196821 RepID=UPI000C8865B7|nr:MULTISPECIES: hypothetical protein [unclassified Pseudomonas]PMX08442.1 hypothetical protein C1Y25_24010 [Pseudomonas sp. MPBC4-3]PMX44690.1 hypothetical protein C1Y20_24290 [Pseudomonas sp. FW301-21B01]PMY02223.1 hypothetical protein C1Y18_31280 [Pseudomonas sp. MPR-R5A]PNA65233.1 hypothetical protein C1Y14_24430 [Pseudomonas sp. MPR-R5B]
MSIKVRTTHSKIDNKTYRFDTVITVQGVDGLTQTQLVDKRELRNLRFITAKDDAGRREQFARFLNDTVEMRVRRAVSNVITQAQLLKESAQ